MARSKSMKALALQQGHDTGSIKYCETLIIMSIFQGTLTEVTQIFTATSTWLDCHMALLLLLMYHTEVSPA